MRGIEVAELVLLAAAFTVGLLLAAALLHQFCRRSLGVLGGIGITSNKPPASSPELPVSQPTTTSPRTNKNRLILLLTLCSGRRHSRARVEPTSPPAAVTAVEVEDVARWRERWFGPASRALYTIDEEDEEEDRPETPFYTPPVSPPRIASSSSSSSLELEVAVEVEASAVTTIRNNRVRFLATTH